MSHIIPLFITLALCLVGVFVYDSMEWSLFYIPSGIHDFYYILILAASATLDKAKNHYQSIVGWLIATIFIIATSMQIFDYRAIGATGSYDLHTDNIMYAITLLALFITVFFLSKTGYIAIKGRMIYLCCISLGFLAFNILLTIKEIRELVHNYALVYDYVFYTYLYLVCISASNPVCNAIRNSYNSLNSLLHTSNSNLLSDKRK